MTHTRYRTLLGAALAAMFVGTAVAQTTSDDPSRMPADKGMPQAQQTQPSEQPTDKMKGQPKASAPAADKAPATDKAPAPDQAAKKTSAAKPSTTAKQASKSNNQRIAALDPNERAFRDALRQCAKQQDQRQRDSCLDSAIEQFQRG